jgi:uncharacterized protein (TIGR02145 family)
MDGPLRLAIGVLLLGGLVRAAGRDDRDSAKRVDPSTVTRGTFVDKRDQAPYPTVTIGSRTWMARNLNFASAGSSCYEHGPARCATYGRLYTWEAARRACPSGWHLPTDQEWTALVVAAGGSGAAGGALKASLGWNADGSGADLYGFQALPGGSRDRSGNCVNMGSNAFFWSSSAVSMESAWYRGLGWASDVVDRNFDYQDDGFSVRCVKDAP